MAMAHDAQQEQRRIERVLTTDFCPWANRYVYWLKEPIGWFVTATCASVLVGLYANPIGWTIAGALACIILVGMAWPLIAVWACSCRLRPEVEAVHESESCRMIFSVRNRVPIPVWGLTVEGYLDCEGDEQLPVVALSHVPPICVADYAIAVQPTMRGHYPVDAPKIACSFPFGIWTARRALNSLEPLTVWPRVYRIAGVFPLTGKVNTDVGDGQRGGRSGDFVGVRGFRRGDSPRHINWAQTAKTDTLIVTERGGPQNVDVELSIDPSMGMGDSRQTLAIRMRVAASILCNILDAKIPVRVMIGRTRVRCVAGSRGRRQLLNALADVPVDGSSDSPSTALDCQHTRIQVRSEQLPSQQVAHVIVQVTSPNGASRSYGSSYRKTIHCDQRVEEQLMRLWQELGDVPLAV